MNTCPALVVVVLRPASSLNSSHTGASHAHGPLLCPLVNPESIICRVIAPSFLCLYGRNCRMSSSKPCHGSARQQRSQTPSQFVVGPARVILRPPSSSFHPSCHGVVEVGPSLMHVVSPFTSMCRIRPPRSSVPTAHGPPFQAKPPFPLIPPLLLHDPCPAGRTTNPSYHQVPFSVLITLTAATYSLSFCRCRDPSGNRR